MISASVCNERFQVIAWRHAQITQIDSSIQITELAARDFDQIGWKALWAFASEDGLSGSILKPADHASMYQSMIQCQAAVSVNDTIGKTVTAVTSPPPWLPAAAHAGASGGRARTAIGF